MNKFEDIRSAGILWALNKYIFHPRGFAIAITLDQNDKALGWELYGDGTELWEYEEQTDEEGFKKFEAFLNLTRTDPKSPPSEIDSDEET